MTLRVRLEPLASSSAKLPAIAGAALANGSLHGLPVARSLAEIPRPVERHDPGQRALLAETLERELGRLDPPGRVLTSIHTLGSPGGFCVVTGQQPGLCSGPLSSLYKGLQACRLATELSREWGTPVAPVFWNHADDHDIAEVHHAYQLNRNLDLQKVGLAGLSSGRKPISEITLEAERNRLPATRAMLTQMFEEFPTAEDAVELFFPCDGETLAQAFTRAMTHLLGPFGLVVVEPDWLRSDLSSALADLVSKDPLPHLVEGSGDDAAIPPQDAALVYRVGDKGRSPLRCGPEGFKYDGEPGSRTAAELAAEIVGEPAQWSAGALLRPLVQDSVFPICAYVGGWGELGYHAQLTRLRSAADLPLTPFVPRISIFLLGPDVEVALTRTEMTLDDALSAAGGLDPQSPAAEEHPAVVRLRAEAAEAMNKLLELRSDLKELEPALAVNLKRTTDQVLGLVDKLAQKAQRVHDNRQGKGRRQVRRLNNTLFPRGIPQERVLGPLLLLRAV